MNCDEAEILLHGLVDNELDHEHADRIEAHVRDCARCAAQLDQHRVMRERMANADLRFAAPPGLRTRINARLSASVGARPYLRTLFKGFAFGSALSAAAAALLMIAVTRSDPDQVIVSDVVSAHLRSLQASRLIDVQPGDHAVRPWLGNRLGVAPPVPDLSSEGFSLVGGRIDYVLGKPVAAIVYRTGGHLINLFVAQGADAEHGARLATLQGVNVDLWSEKGFNLCAAGDVSGEELDDFRRKFEAAAWTGQI
jgi:anti-sigma factor RsiW